MEEDSVNPLEKDYVDPTEEGYVDSLEKVYVDPTEFLVKEEDLIKVEPTFEVLFIRPGRWGLKLKKQPGIKLLVLPNMIIDLYPF